MLAHRRLRPRRLLIALAICGAIPGLARSDPAMYSGSVHLRMWQRPIPYGALSTGPGLANSPSGDPVNLVGAGPAAFTLSAARLALTTSLFDPSPTPFPWLDYRATKFTAANDAGSFFGGGAPGSTGLAPLSSVPASQFGVSFSGPPNRFGGVMKLLGRFELRYGWGTGPADYFQSVFPLSAIGGAFGGTATAKADFGGTAGFTYVTATAWGFPWDTGTVAAAATNTSTSAMGMDLRSPSGLGTLQLVTPFLVHVRSYSGWCDCEDRWFYGGTAHLELHFVPEPAVNVLLVAGLGALVVLHRRSLRRRP